MGYRARLVDEPQTHIISGDWHTTRELLLGDPELDPFEQVLTMAFDNHLHIAGQGGFEDDIGKARLHSRVKMDFWLLQDDRGALRNVGEEDENREHLGDTESYVREKDLGRGLRPLHVNAIDVSAFLDWCYTEGVDKA